MSTFPKILGIIPARGGSKGLINKNMKLLAGRPLLQYTIESSLKSEPLDSVMISTDSQKIIKFAAQFPEVQIPFLRPKHLAQDNTSTLEVVEHALQHHSQKGIHFDYIALLQPTSPFRSDNMIDNAIRVIIEKQADCLISVQKIPDKFNPKWAFFQEEMGLLKMAETGKKLIGRRQDLPDTFHRDGKIYITKTSLIRQGKLVGGKIASLVTENEPNINIDSQTDWQEAQIEIIKWKAGTRNPFC